jgi:hypothetical protein
MKPDWVSVEPRKIPSCPHCGEVLSFPGILVFRIIDCQKCSKKLRLHLGEFRAVFPDDPSTSRRLGKLEAAITSRVKPKVNSIEVLSQKQLDDIWKSMDSLSKVECIMLLEEANSS